MQWTLADVKLLHTIVWAFFVVCIVAIPLAASRGRLRTAEILCAIVLVECGIIAANHGRCPLTDVAARLTEDRADNFDIYLPVWVARWNKVIFGSLYLFGLLFTFGFRKRNRSKQRRLAAAAGSMRLK